MTRYLWKTPCTTAHQDETLQRLADDSVAVHGCIETAERQGHDVAARLQAIASEQVACDSAIQAHVDVMAQVGGDASMRTRRMTVAAVTSGSGLTLVPACRAGSLRKWRPPASPKLRRTTTSWRRCKLERRKLRQLGRQRLPLCRLLK